jgi:hypothetical protein
MRWKSTLLLFAAAAGIAAYIALYEIRQLSPAERDRVSRQLLDLDAQAITEITLEMPEGSAHLVRNGPGWRNAQTGLRADTDLVGQLVWEASTLTAARVLSRAPEHSLDLKSYGLDPPLGRLTLVGPGGASTILFGETTAVGGFRYASRADRPEAVGVVTGTLFAAANRAPDTFRDRACFRFEAGAVQAVEVRRGEAAWRIERATSGWTAAGVDEPLDADKVDDLLYELQGLRATGFVDDPAEASSLIPAGSITVALEGTRQHLTVSRAGKDGKDWRGKLEGEPGLAVLTQQVDQTLQQTLEDLRPEPPDAPDAVSPPTGSGSTPPP